MTLSLSVLALGFLFTSACGQNFVQFRNDMGTVVYVRCGDTREEMVSSGVTKPISTGKHRSWKIDAFDQFSLYCEFLWVDRERHVFMAKGFQVSGEEVFGEYSKRDRRNSDLGCIYKLKREEFFIFSPPTGAYVSTGKTWEIHQAPPIPLPAYAVIFKNDIGATAYGNCGYTKDEARSKDPKQFAHGNSIRYNINLLRGQKVYCIFVWIDRELHIFKVKGFAVFDSETSNRYYRFWRNGRRSSFYKLGRSRMYILSPTTGYYTPTSITWDVDEETAVPDLGEEHRPSSSSIQAQPFLSYP